MQLSDQQKQLVFKFMNGEMNDHPVVKAIYKMIDGKTPKEKATILTNMLRSRGIDVDSIRFTREELKNFGLIN